MIKKGLNIFNLMCISMLTVVIVGCSNNSNKVTSDDFDINSSKLESNDGSYTISIEFYEKAGLANYKIYENNKEIKSGRKDTNGKDSKEFIFANKPNGEYVYELKVEDDNSGVTSKDVKVKVENKEVAETQAENKDKEVENKTNESTWSKESIEYKVKDKVIFNNKTYECVQTHISQEDWSPVNATSLWKAKS